MGRDQLKDRVFLLLYGVLLLYALAWMRMPHVQRHVGENAALLRLIILAAMCHVAVHAFLVLTRRVGDRAWWLWLAVDLPLVTAVVRLTGGLNSEASLVYLIPLLTGTAELRPARALWAGVGSGVLYVVGVWHPGFGAGDLQVLMTRLVFLAAVTVLAARYAATERDHVEELARLREAAALAEYRAELSQDLHDGIQHYLVAAVVRLEMAKELAKRDPGPAASMAVDVRHTLHQASDELRYLVRRLRSPKLERLGFIEALREHLALYADNAPFAMDVEVEAEEVGLPPEIEQAVLRVIQEALTNAVKYASATAVRVSLRLTPELLECTVADNGTGFEPDPTAPEGDATHGLGLAGMRHRAEGVDGQVEIQSAPGNGTQVRLTIPVAAYVRAKQAQVVPRRAPAG